MKTDMKKQLDAAYKKYDALGKRRKVNILAHFKEEGLGTRARYCLLYSGIYHMRYIKRIPDVYLHFIPNCGRKTIREIRAASDTWERINNGALQEIRIWVPKSKAKKIRDLIEGMLI